MTSIKELTPKKNMRIREVVAEDKDDLLKILNSTGVFKDFPHRISIPFALLKEKNRAYRNLAMIGDFYRPGDLKTIYGKNLLS